MTCPSTASVIPARCDTVIEDALFSLYCNFMFDVRHAVRKKFWESGMTLESLADKLTLTPDHLALIFSGNTEATVETYFNIALVIGIRLTFAVEEAPSMLTDEIARASAVAEKLARE